MALTMGLFSLFPGIDLWVAAQGYDPATGFWMNEIPLSGFLRRTIWGLTLAMVALSVVGCGLGFALRRDLLGVARGAWVFILGLYLIGPGLIVNGGLKAHWGRARPAMVTDFGGPAQYTPPVELTDQCLRNCSFVSGEGSASVALCVALIVILAQVRPRLAPMVWRAGQGVAVLLALVGSGQRVLTGRHFLSDTIMALWIVLLVAVLLWAAINRFFPQMLRHRGAAVDNPDDSPYTPPT